MYLLIQKLDSEKNTALQKWKKASKKCLTIDSS